MRNSRRGIGLGFTSHLDPTRSEEPGVAIQELCDWLLADLREHFKIDPDIDDEHQTAFRSEGQIRGGAHDGARLPTGCHTPEEWARWSAEQRRWRNWRRENTQDMRRAPPVQAQAAWQQDYGRRPLNRNQYRYQQERRAQAWMDSSSRGNLSRDGSRSGSAPINHVLWAINDINPFWHSSSLLPYETRLFGVGGIGTHVPRSGGARTNTLLRRAAKCRRPMAHMKGRTSGSSKRAVP